MYITPLVLYHPQSMARYADERTSEEATRRHTATLLCSLYVSAAKPKLLYINQKAQTKTKQQTMSSLEAVPRLANDPSPSSQVAAGVLEA